MTSLLIGVLVTEIIKYGIWFIGIQGLRIKRLYVGGIIAGICILLIVTEVINQDTLLIELTIIVAMSYGVLFECDRGNRGVHIIQAFFVMVCADEIICGVMKLIQKIDWYTSAKLKENHFICNMIIIMIFCIWALVKKRMKVLKNRKNGKVYRWGIYFITAIMGTSLLLTISGFQYIAKYVESERINIFSKIISIISFICIACMLLIMLYIFKENERYKIYLEKDVLLLETQKKMYQAMLAKNEETRRFRHDLQNHLMCMNELAAHNDLGKVQKYIEGMEGNLQSIQNKVYIVGNTVIDVVINYYISMLKDDVEVSITGRCAPNIGMRDVELCTVISNLMQNAEEALNKTETKNCYLKVDFQSSKGYIQIRIRNSISEGSIVLDRANQIPITTKENRKEHGIGMRNVKETVEKSGGIFEVNVGDGEFAVFVMIPLDENNS